MSPNELELSSQGLILKIHVVTGWKLSENEVELSILQTELQHSLTENYPSLNIDEIMFAFRKYAKDVKEYGKYLNLANISEVLDIYIDERHKVSEIEAGIAKTNEITFKPSSEDSENMNRGYIEALYQQYLLGELQSYRLLPHYAIDQIYKDGFCGIDLPESFYEQAKKSEVKRIAAEIEDLRLQRKSAKITEKEIEVSNLDSSESVKLIAKRMALLYFFSEAKKSSLQHIYLKKD